MDVLTFYNCVCIRNKRDNVVITVFDDCNHVYALPQNDSEYIQRAKDLGYTNERDMNYEHDAVHCFLHQYLNYGDYYSPSLYNVCKPGYSTEDIRQIEERIVLDFQLYLNKNVITEFLKQAVIKRYRFTTYDSLELTLDKLRKTALQKLRSAL